MTSRYGVLYSENRRAELGISFQKADFPPFESSIFTLFKRPIFTLLKG